MTLIGKIKQFKPEEESITAYLKRVELYFVASDITEGEKKVIIFAGNFIERISIISSTKREYFWTVDESTEETL